MGLATLEEGEWFICRELEFELALLRLIPPKSAFLLLAPLGSDCS
jgi:hypothetical protein